MPLLSSIFIGSQYLYLKSQRVVLKKVFRYLNYTSIKWFKHVNGKSYCLSLRHWKSSRPPIYILTYNPPSFFSSTLPIRNQFQKMGKYCPNIKACYLTSLSRDLQSMSNLDLHIDNLTKKLSCSIKYKHT